ncbi:kinetochore protein Mis14 like-domain-containing protein [Scheffersomyces amazonensis]|uniref:kinetochore protein Mis14 like-domain-containing protein n=1 Tax=Scheffersomyces amazonensis TaxID=1078765 RepID=UPI00315DAE5D
MNGTTDYEKIAISKQDLKYVYNQILNKTTSKLDLHLPTSNNDPLKAKVGNLLDEFLLEAFELAKSAFIIDGKDIDAGDQLSISEILSLRAKETVEPFDLNINSRLREILLQVEQETVELTKLRRELPFKAKESYDNLVSSTDKEVSTILELLEQQEKEEEEKDDILMNEDEIPNFSSLLQDYERHILTLNDLKKSIPLRKAELDRFDETIQFLETAYKKQQIEFQ